MTQDNSQSLTSLTSIMNRHGSDKGSGHHNYTEYYSLLFSPLRDEKISLLEIGIGTVNPTIPSSMIGTPGGYTPGSSLRGWQEYFPQGKIYGCDIDTDILFQTDRISTFFLDQTNPEIISSQVCNREETWDIIIDDGLHHFPTNWAVLKQIFHKLKPTGIYIIEDILNFDPGFLDEKFVQDKQVEGWVFEYLRIPNEKNPVDNNILIVRKKPVKTDLVIITNTIHVSNPKRSMFSPEERFAQVQHSITKVREKLPTARIMLMEMSKISTEMSEYFQQACDFFISGAEDDFTQYYNRIAKNFGEVCQLLLALEKIPPDTGMIYKLSGRYYFSDDFTLEEFDRTKYNFMCIFNEWNHHNVYQTTFYGFPYSKIADFKATLFRCIDFIKDYSIDIETAIYAMIDRSEVHELSKLYCQGLYATDGKFYSL